MIHVMLCNDKPVTVPHALWVAQGLVSSILSALWAPQCSWASQTAFCWWLYTPCMPETHAQYYISAFYSDLIKNASSPNKHCLTSCICWCNLRASLSSNALARALRFFTRVCRMASTLTAKGPMMMAEGMDWSKSLISLRCTRTSCFTSWGVWFSWLCNLKDTKI